MSMNQNHPIQYLVSQDYAKNQQWLTIVFSDTLYITGALLFAVYYCAGFNPLAFFDAGKAVLGVLTIAVPALAVFLIRYHLHDRMPLWLRLTIKLPSAALFLFGIVHLCLKLTA